MSENNVEVKSLVIEGRNAVLEAFRSGRPIDKLFVQEGHHCERGKET